MSILKTFPKHIRESIISKDKKLREDLLVIPELESKGWEVSFPDDELYWRNCATFSLDDYTIYYHKFNWILSKVSNNGVDKKYFDELKDAICAAC